MKAPLATEKLLEDTNGLAKGRRSNPSATSRCGGLRLPLSADVCSLDDVIAF